MDPSCPICFETFIGCKDIYATKCGHYSHYNCLLKWIKKSRACPECRTLCTDKDIFRIFFTFDSETTGIALNAKIENIELEFCTKIKEAELFVSDDINAIKEQQSRYIEETEEKLMLLNKQFKDQLKAEQDFKIKMQKKIKRMEKKSSEVVGEVVQKLVLLAVLAIIYFHWFKEV